MVYKFYDLTENEIAVEFYLPFGKVETPRSKLETSNIKLDMSRSKFETSKSKLDMSHFNLLTRRIFRLPTKESSPRGQANHTIGGQSFIFDG